jgi:hypothetical protein
MNLLVHRYHQDDKAVLGNLFLDRVWECHVLEDPKDLVPEGNYKLTVYLSPKFRRQVLLLHGVPGRSYIEIHAGNTVDDTEGCVLVGQQLKLQADSAFVGASRLALDALLKKFKEPCTLTITKDIKWTA